MDWYNGAQLNPTLISQVKFIELTDEEKLDLACSDLKIVYVSGDSDSSVTKDITLVTEGLHGTTIVWNSSNEDVISDSGEVIRPENGDGDATVTLTATISINGIQTTKEFVVTVIEMEEEGSGEPVEPVIILQSDFGKPITLIQLTVILY